MTTQIKGKLNQLTRLLPKGLVADAAWLARPVAVRRGLDGVAAVPGRLEPLAGVALQQLLPVGARAAAARSEPAVSAVLIRRHSDLPALLE